MSERRRLDISVDETPPWGIPIGAARPDEPLRPFSSRVQVEFGARTHTGKVRRNNEDAYLIYRTGRYWEKLLTSLPQEELPERFDENAYVMVVADGMGGHAGGEVASRIAITTAVNLILGAARWALKLDQAERDSEIEAATERARTYARKIDETLTRHAEANPALDGMGTTLTAAYSFGVDLLTFHVGDSRAYMFRDGVLSQLTRDQTVAQALVDSGKITPEEAAGHRLRHVLTDALGGHAGKVSLAIDTTSLRDGDRILLCSDGLTDMVDDEAIAEVLQRTAGSAQACQALLELALEQGGKDNVTVLIGGYGIPPAEP